MILTILSQNTNAANYNESFARLRGLWPSWERLKDAPCEEIAEAIRPGGLANLKAPRIKRILIDIHRRQGTLDLEWLAGVPLSEALDYLMGFQGVGRKTAACVMMFALNAPVMPVDTHVHRISTRLGLIGKMSADDAHDALLKIIPPEDIYSLHVNMVAHGRQVCRAARPRCEICVLKEECAEAKGQGYRVTRL